METLMMKLKYVMSVAVGIVVFGAQAATLYAASDEAGDALAEDGPVEYLQGDGVAYIDTGVNLTQNDCVEIVFQNLTLANAHIFGSRTSATVNNFSMGITETMGGVPTKSLYADFKDYSAAGARLGMTLADNSMIMKLVSSADARSIVTTDGMVLAESANRIAGEFTTPDTCRLFGIKGGWGGFRGRIYSFRIIRGGDLLLDLVPWRKDGVLCFKDRVSGTCFFNAAGSGTFITGERRAFIGARVEYLQGTGSGRIALGYVLTSADRVEMDCSFPVCPPPLMQIMGCRDAASDKNFSVITALDARDVLGAVALDFNDGDFTPTRLSTPALSKASEGERLHIELGAAKRSVVRLSDGEVLAESTEPIADEFTTSGECWLFGVNGEPPQTHPKGTLRIHSFRIWRGEELKMDLVPYQSVDGLGFLDLVSGRLYTPLFDDLISGPLSPDQLLVVGVGETDPSEGATDGLETGDRLNVRAAPYREGGKTYRPVGWKLYRLDDEDYTVWTPIAQGRRSSFTYEHPGYATRLVWQYSDAPKSGLAIIL